MSEVLNAEVTSSEEGGLSRRRIVKGAAWSMPVIAAAIAAPAASASGKIEALLDFASPDAATFVQSGKEAISGQFRIGKGPLGFHITNTTGVTSGSIQGSISITSPDAADPRVGVHSFGAAALTNKSAVTTQNFTANFEYSSGVGSTRVDFPISFYYTGSKTVGAGKVFNLSISFTAPAALVGTPLGATLTL